MISVAYYNAGSAALILVLILAFIGLFLYWRSRRQRRKGLGRVNLPTEQDREERIPLSTNVGGPAASREDVRLREREEEGQPIFDVGDDSGSEDERDKHRR